MRFRLAERLRRALCLAALGACVVLGATVVRANVTSDTWITTNVKMLLLMSPEVNGMHLHVDSSNGRVTLFGTAGSEVGKAAAERLASQVIGVRSTRNLISVVPERRQEEGRVVDTTVEQNVAIALRGDPALANSAIRVASVDDGTVVLGGGARSLSELRRALRIARGIAGVRRVASVVEGPQLLSDAEIWSDQAGGDSENPARDNWLTAAVKIRLMADPAVTAGGVSVDTEDGVVTLFGTVPSEAAKRAAKRTAEAVPGVRSVHNQLLVRRGETAQRALAPAALRHRVAEALAETPGLADAAIVVDVPAADTVRLSGFVATHAALLTALTIAQAAAPDSAIVDALRVSVSPAPPQHAPN